ncbi:hypothetical protein MRX96_025545 [Rhipicephalus microplus]
MAVVAGWLLHCELHKSSDAAMTHIAFRRDVTMSLLQLKQKLTVRPGPRVHLRHENRKTDGHYIISTTQGRSSKTREVPVRSPLPHYQNHLSAGAGGHACPKASPSVTSFPHR